MTPDFESKFREWWDLVWENHISFDPGDFDYMEAIKDFLKSPNTSLSIERKFKKEMDEKLEKQMDQDIESGAFNPDEEVDEYFINSFGIRMKRQK